MSNFKYIPNGCCAIRSFLGRYGFILLRVIESKDGKTLNCCLSVRRTTWRIAEDNIEWRTKMNNMKIAYCKINLLSFHPTNYIFFYQFIEDAIMEGWIQHLAMLFFIRFFFRGVKLKRVLTRLFYYMALILGPDEIHLKRKRWWGLFDMHCAYVRTEKSGKRNKNKKWVLAKALKTFKNVEHLLKTTIHCSKDVLKKFSWNLYIMC